MLISYGWKAAVSPQMVEQLLILLTFVVGGVPGRQESHNPPEEVVVEALACLTALVQNASASATASAALVEAKNVPALGHAVTVILESIVDGETPEIKRQALHALQALFQGIRDHAALATFLPGVVSNLARLLATPAREKTRVLVAAVESLQTVLLAVLSDLRTRSILMRGSSEVEDASVGDKILSASWLKATTMQIRLALVGVLKLRTASSEQVRAAVGSLALALLDECHATLENCAPPLVETCIMLAPDTEPSFSSTTSLSDLATIYPELGETIKSTVYGWITGLRRIMQSADEDKKQTALRNVLRGTRLVAQLRLDSSTLDDAVSLALRESVSSLIQDDRQKLAVHSNSMDLQVLADRDRSTRDIHGVEYPLVVLRQESQVGTRSEMLALLSSIGNASHQVKLSLDMLDYTRESQGALQTSSFWLSFELTKAAIRASSDIDEFVDFSGVTDNFEDPKTALDELYAYSASLLDTYGEPSDADWKIQAIALEVIAFAASKSKEAFRPELIDVLYPIATLLGSPHPGLRDHAITTLDMLAASCGYASVSELIVENADYMINSISLRMNTLDITPASTKVLIMMTRLTGPHLIPYLDDVVASIFSALDNYHGYPVFVESLFAVLREVVEQGVKSDMLLEQGRETGTFGHKKQLPAATDLADVLRLLDARERRERDREEEDAAMAAIDGHPSQPWGKNQTADAAEVPGEGDEPGMEVEKEKPPKTPTYVLLEKVAALTQHYLTSPTPTLRKSLLDLLSSVSPALSKDEDAFLPLVNAVWPVVTARLRDPEPFVVLAACNALGALCATAGDFLSSRIRTEWHDGLARWCRAKKDEALRKARSGAPSSTSNLLALKSSSSPALWRGLGMLELRPETPSLPGDIAYGNGLGRFASAAQTWEAVVALLVAIVSHVRVPDDIFDDILALLADRLGRDVTVRAALEVVNTDAVWLVMYEQGMISSMETPQLGQVVFQPMVVFT